MKLVKWLRKMLNQQNLVGEMLRYLVIGGIAFVADYGTLLILNKTFHINYLVAASVAFCLGIFVNYLGSINFVFQVRSLRNPHLERVLFLTIGLIGLVINDGMLYLLTGQLSIAIEYSKLIAQALVLFWNFMARKILLFSKVNKDAS